MGTSANTVLHYYNIMLNVCKISRVLRQNILGFCLSKSIFGVFCQWHFAKYFLSRSEIPNSADPCL